MSSKLLQEIQKNRNNRNIAKFEEDLSEVKSPIILAYIKKLEQALRGEYPFAEDIINGYKSEAGEI